MCHYIEKYVEITKGFMRLLKKGVPFVCDDQAQCLFDAPKDSLTSTPLLHPFDYTWGCHPLPCYL